MPEGSTLAPRRASIVVVGLACLFIFNLGVLAWSSISKGAHLDTCRAQAKTLADMVEKSIASQKIQIETIEQQAAAIQTLKASLVMQRK